MRPQRPCSLQEEGDELVGEPARPWKAQTDAQSRLSAGILQVHGEERTGSLERWESRVASCSGPELLDD